MIEVAILGKYVRYFISMVSYPNIIHGFCKQSRVVYWISCYQLRIVSDTCKKRFGINLPAAVGTSGAVIQLYS